MKNKFKLIFMSLALALSFSCDEEEILVADNYVAFEDDSIDVALEAGGSASGQFNVYIVGNASSDRTYNILVEDSAPATSYSIPSTVTIPAGSNFGTVQFDIFDDGSFGILGDTIELNIEDTADNLVFDDLILDVAITCDTPVVVNFVFDLYASETSWNLYDSDGEIIVSGGDYADGDTGITREFCLAPGDYSFEVFDGFGDGICCAYGNGSYSVTQGTNVYVSGGSFGVSESTSFTVE